MKKEAKYLLLIVLISFGLSSLILSILGLVSFIPQFFTLAIVDSIKVLELAGIKVPKRDERALIWR